MKPLAEPGSVQSSASTGQDKWKEEKEQKSTGQVSRASNYTLEIFTCISEVEDTCRKEKEQERETERRKHNYGREKTQS